MHLTLRQLQCFSAVARNLSYTKAAEELHLTQPAVSMQIRQLEQQAGLALNSNDRTLQVVRVGISEAIDIKGAPVKGPSSAPVTIAVFSDFQ